MMANLGKRPLRNRHYLSVIFLITVCVGMLSMRSSMFWRPAQAASAVTLPSADIAKVESACVHPSYDLIDNHYIEEYGIRAILYSHRKSGAQVMSVIAPDENKVFGITFRTPPPDSTGIAHILEHSMLCGSRKYPVKKPFVDMLKGSLQNYLNALTYPDRTCYPLASTNSKDFYNLIDVYLDAVLYPRAAEDPMVFEQEGWHYEIEDKTQPLTYKGVVYNEMKGVYSSPGQLLERITRNVLFPDNAYGVDSGGKPVVIPDLTFDQFKNFHSSHYHPTNSRVYFYGNDDPEKRLDLLDEYLKEFDKIDIDSAVKYQPKRLKPTKIEVKIPVAPGTEPKHMVTVNWLLNDEALSSKDSLALGVLNSLLLGTSSAFLRKTLTESQLGESVIGGGISGDLLQATFSVGLKGVMPEKKDEVEALVVDTLKHIADTGAGFERDAVDAALNTLEFQLREFNTGSFPRGLSLMLAMLSQWIYDQEPLEGVRFEAALKGLKDDLETGKPVFQDLLKQFVIGNEHRVTIDMKPDAKVEEEVAQAEVSRLAKIKEQLTDSELESIIEKTKALKEAQLAEDSPEAKATIPRLALTDIEPTCRELPIQVVQDGRSGEHEGISIVAHDVPSNGILYMDLGLDFSRVREEDIPFLALFTRMITGAGTKAFDQVALSRRIGMETGGIGASMYTDLRSSKDSLVVDGDDALLYIMLRGKATREKIPVMLDIMQDVLLNANLDNQKRAVEMLKESKARKQSAVITSGHSYGNARLAARYSFLGWFGEITAGVTSVRNAGKLLEAAEQDWPSVEARLLRIREAVVRKGSVLINLSADEETLEAAYSALPALLKTLPTPSSAVAAQESLLAVWKATKAEKLLPTTNEGFVVPSQVNYVCKGGPIYSPGEKVSGASTVVSRHLNTGYLWNSVRVMGGAYGGISSFSQTTGRVSFLSYRDPNLVKTINIYDSAADAVATAAEEMAAHPEELTMSVIGAVGELDSPMSPDQKGFRSFVEWLTGQTHAQRQQFRNEVLSTSPADFAAFASKLRGFEDSGSAVVFGSQAALTHANEELPEGKTLRIENAIMDN